MQHTEKSVLTITVCMHEACQLLPKRSQSVLWNSNEEFFFLHTFVVIKTTFSSERMPRLIWVFAESQISLFVVLWLNYDDVYAPDVK